jgi:acetate kinase
VEKVLAILAINIGAYSVKFKIYSDTHPPRLLASGSVTGIGSDKGSCTIIPVNGPTLSYGDIAVKSPSEAIIPILEWIQQQKQYSFIAIGHRVLDGVYYTEPLLIDEKMIEEFKRLKTLSPSYIQSTLSIVNTFRQAFPSVPQVACFDAHFHNNLPFKNGFHGLSCEYIIGQLQQLDILPDNEKIIIAHLGNNCSMTAIRGKESIDSSGDFSLKTIAETTDDMSQLLQAEHTDIEARKAIHLFCNHVKKQIGSLAAVLGGLDTLVFTGGIGEFHHRIRTRICNDLEFLGIRLNDVLNKQSYAIISGSNSKVTVYAIKTNEEVIIAKHVQYLFESSHAIRTSLVSPPTKTYLS